jgi:hypothetical protein
MPRYEIKLPDLIPGDLTEDYEDFIVRKLEYAYSQIEHSGFNQASTPLASLALFISGEAERARILDVHKRTLITIFKPRAGEYVREVQDAPRPRAPEPQRTLEPASRLEQGVLNL